MYMAMMGIILLILICIAFFDWHARMVFMARGYPRKYGHGKTWKRAHAHYKKSWTLAQRLLWLPVFKETYVDTYRHMAYIAYAHAIFALITITAFLINEFVFPEPTFWHYVFTGFAIFTILRFFHTNHIARHGSRNERRFK